MAKTPSKIMSAGELRTAKAALKKTIGEHSSVVKVATKAIKAAEAEAAKAIKAAAGTLAAAQKAHDAAVKAANKALDVAKKDQNKVIAGANKDGTKAEADLAALDATEAA